MCLLLPTSFLHASSRSVRALHGLFIHDTCCYLPRGLLPPVWVSSHPSESAAARCRRPTT